jgi:hypothetical protein
MATGTWSLGGGTDVYRATISFDRAGQKCQTGFHLREGTYSGSDPAEVAALVEPWATGQFAKLLQQSEKITGIDVEHLNSKTGHSISPANAPGVLASALTPSYMSVSVALKGSLRRRYGSGRMLWPVSSQSYIDVNNLSASALTTFNAVITDLVDRFVTNPITKDVVLCHLHGTIAATENHPVIQPAWYDVTSVRLNRQLSAVRRRMQGSGS